MKLTILNISALGVLLLAASAASNPNEIGSVAQLANCGTCYRGQQCSSGEHKHFDVSDFDQDSPDGVHSTCNASDCCYATQGGGDCKHPVCIVSFGLRDKDYETVVAAIDRNDMRTVASFVRKYPTAIELNRARSSVQFIGCDSSVAANYPVSGRQLDELIRRTD